MQYTTQASNLAVPIFRVVSYHLSDTEFEYEYICETEASKTKADQSRRIRRLKRAVGTNNTPEVSWAIGPKGYATADFVFFATDENYVHNVLSYNDL